MKKLTIKLILALYFITAPMLIAQSFADDLMSSFNPDSQNTTPAKTPAESTPAKKDSAQSTTADNKSSTADNKSITSDKPITAEKKNDAIDSLVLGQDKLQAEVTTTKPESKPTEPVATVDKDTELTLAPQQPITQNSQPVLATQAPAPQKPIVQNNPPPLNNENVALLPNYSAPINTKQSSTISTKKSYDVPVFNSITNSQSVDNRPDYASLIAITSGDVNVSNRVDEISKRYPIQILATGGNTGTGFVYAQTLCMHINTAISFLLRSCVAIAVDNVTAVPNLLTPNGQGNMLITREDYWAASIQKTGPLYTRQDLRLVSFLNYATLTVIAHKRLGVDSVESLKRKIAMGKVIKIAILRPTDADYAQDFIASILAPSNSLNTVMISDRAFDKRFCSDTADIDMLLTVGGSPDYLTSSLRGKCDKDIVPIALTKENISNLQKVNPFYTAVEIPQVLYSKEAWRNIPLSLSTKSKFYSVGIRQVLLSPSNEDPILIFHTVRTFVKQFPDIRQSMPTYDFSKMNTEDLIRDKSFNPMGLYHSGLYNYMFIHNDFFAGMGFLTVNDFKFYNLISTINPNSPKVTFDGQIVMVDEATKQDNTELPDTDNEPVASAPLPYLQPDQAKK